MAKKEKKVNYNNNPILKWCLCNTSIKRDDNDNIRPVKQKKKRKLKKRKSKKKKLKLQNLKKKKINLKYLYLK